MTSPHKKDRSELYAPLLGSRNLFSVSELYHENSKITSSAPGIALSAESIIVAPTGFKRYMHAERKSLPPAGTGTSSATLSAIVERRSCRQYSGTALKLEDLSELLFYSLGISGEYRRCSPSAGGLYPLELYVVSINVDGLASGLFHYDVRSHSLSGLGEGDFRPQITSSVFIKEAVKDAGAVMILTGVFGRSKIKYGERAYRFVLLEAGHAMQNICLASTVIGLGTCPIGGFIDDHVNDLLDIDGIEEAALYLVTVGAQVQA